MLFQYYKSSKYSIIYITILAIILLIASSVIFFNSQSVFTEQLIYDSSVKTEKQLRKFLNPVSMKLQEIIEEGTGGNYILDGETSLNKYFIPILKSSSIISSIKYFDISGHQYLIYKDGNTFVTTFRIEKVFNNEVIWKRWQNVNTKISEWKQNIEKDPIRQNWNQYFHSETKHDSIYWLRLKGFGDVSVEEITAVSFGHIKQTNTLFACGIGIKIDDLIKSLDELRLYTNPKLFMINSKDHIIPIIMNFSVSDNDTGGVFTFQNLSDSLVISFLSNWKDLGYDINSTFIIDYKNDRWWGQVDTFQISKSRTKLGVAVLENELIFASFFNTYFILIILFIILLVSSILYFISKKKKMRLSDSLTEEQLKEMLTEGESKYFELKSSLRWDYREEKVNKKLEQVIVKSISAFNNSEGGYLVIGIDDDKNILGLDKDYNSLKKNDSDYFELHLRNLLNSSFTIRYTARKINISFISIENKEICIIKIDKGEYPLYLKTIDKNGNLLEKFFIRSGNSSQEITSLSEINNYINIRFSKE